MADQVKIPVVGSNAQSAMASDHFHSSDVDQITNSLHGDGFLAMKGSSIVDGVPNSNKNLNAEVIVGTGLQVRVREYSAVIDGTVLFSKGIPNINWTTFTADRILTVAVGVSYIVLTSKNEVSNDGATHKLHDVGILSVQSTIPAINSGKILVAKLTIPGGTTQVTAEMIDNSVRDYLLDMDAIYDELLIKIANAGGGGNGGVDSFLESQINIAKVDFKLDTLIQTGNENMFRGFVETYMNDSDIDPAVSEDWVKDGQRIAIAGPNVYNPNLFSQLTMDSISDGQIIDTISGRVLTYYGAASDITLVPGKIGGALQIAASASTIFDGAPMWRGYVSDVTLSFWLKAPLATNGPLSLKTDALWISMSGGANTDGIVQCSANEKGWVTLASTLRGDVASWSDSGWNLITVTRASSGETKLYVNGVLKGTQTMLSGSIPMGDPVRIYVTGGSIIALDQILNDNQVMAAEDILAYYTTGLYPGVGEAPTSATVISKAHVANGTNDTALITARFVGDVTFSVSRDDGTTWTVATPDTVVDISGQPESTAMRVKYTLNALGAVVDDYACFWK